MKDNAATVSATLATAAMVATSANPVQWRDGKGNAPVVGRLYPSGSISHGAHSSVPIPRPTTKGVAYDMRPVNFSRS